MPIPPECEIDDDCPNGFYCRFFWDGVGGEAAGWDNLCPPEVAGGAALGEACDPDPDDNVPGATCAKEDYCVGGYCSQLCESNADCEAGRRCETGTRGTGLEHRARVVHPPPGDQSQMTSVPGWWVMRSARPPSTSST